jgi:hypothetical protein
MAFISQPSIPLPLLTYQTSEDWGIEKISDHLLSSHFFRRKVKKIYSNTDIKERNNGALK